MYRYDEIDQRLVDERVRQFRDQTRRFLAGQLSEEEFRALRLRNGLYIQRYAPMLRISIPYGLLSSRQLRKLSAIARKYDRAYGHFSTRQNLQLNWPKLEQAPDILAELATVQMHAIQTSGNSFRNVTTDHFAGVAQDEIVDSFVWCEIIRQWSTFHPEFSYLPRKFKIAVNGAKADRAAVAVHDIGLHAITNDANQVGFKVLVGGGLGRTPMIGFVIREFLPWQHLLSYLEAILRVYNRYGRRDNIHKARIKILVRERGPEKFRDEVEAEWAHLKDGPATLIAGEIERVAARFTRPGYEELSNRNLSTGGPFGSWIKRNVQPHKVPGYAAVTLSLKKTGVPPGDVTSDQMDAIADLADRYSFGELRVTHEQAHQHHRLPRRRFLRARQRQVDPGRGSDPAPLRRSRLPARYRRARPQHLGLHERMRPPPRRPHRHPRRRQERRGVVPDRDRRQSRENADERGRSGRVAWQSHRPLVRARAGAGRDRAPDRLLSRKARQRGRALRRGRAPHRSRAFQGKCLWQR